MAVLVYAHSKSNSGVTDLNNSESWKDCFDRIDALIDKYNADHPNSEISFDRSRFEGASNNRKLGALATEALSLRVGDVSRDSGPGALSQSGEVMSVGKKETPVIEEPNDWKEETRNFEVKRGYTILDDEDIKAKQVHIGEQNIVINHTECINGILTHTVTVNQGNHAPFCTAEALRDHFGELCSAKNLKSEIIIEFNDVCTPETQEKYNAIRKQMIDDNKMKDRYANVIIKFPWD